LHDSISTCGDAIAIIGPGARIPLLQLAQIGAPGAVVAVTLLQVLHNPVAAHRFGHQVVFISLTSRPSLGITILMTTDARVAHFAGFHYPITTRNRRSTLAWRAIVAVEKRLYQTLHITSISALAVAVIAFLAGDHLAIATQGTASHRRAPITRFRFTHRAAAVSIDAVAVVARFVRRAIAIAAIHGHTGFSRNTKIAVFLFADR
jgi:hypothetical protein